MPGTRTISPVGERLEKAGLTYHLETATQLLNALLTAGPKVAVIAQTRATEAANPEVYVGYHTKAEAKELVSKVGRMKGVASVDVFTAQKK